MAPVDKHLNILFPSFVTNPSAVFGKQLCGEGESNIENELLQHDKTKNVFTPLNIQSGIK